MAPGVSFVLSWQDSHGQPQEETVPALERKREKPEEKFYFADVPPWLMEGIRPFTKGELETATMYYHIATGTHKIVASWKTDTGNNLVGDIDHERVLDTIGVSQGIRIEGQAPPAA